MSTSPRQPTPSVSANARGPATPPQHSFPRAEKDVPLVQPPLPIRTRKTALSSSSRPPLMPQTPKTAHTFATGLLTPDSTSTSWTRPGTPRYVESSPLGGPSPQIVEASPSPPQQILHPSIQSHLYNPTLEAAYPSPLHQAAKEGRQYARMRQARSQAQAAAAMPPPSTSGSPSSTANVYFTAHHRMPPPPSVPQPMLPPPPPPYTPFPEVYHAYPSPSTSSSHSTSSSDDHGQPTPLRSSLKRGPSTDLGGDHKRVNWSPNIKEPRVTHRAKYDGEKPRPKHGASKQHMPIKNIYVPHYLGEHTQTPIMSPAGVNYSYSSGSIHQGYTAPVAGPSTLASKSAAASRKRKHVDAKDTDDEIEVKLEPVSPTLPKRQKLAPEPEAGAGALVLRKTSKRPASGASNRKKRSKATAETPLPHRSPSPETIEIASDSGQEILARYRDFPADPKLALAFISKRSSDERSSYPAPQGPAKPSITLSSNTFEETKPGNGNGPAKHTVGHSRRVEAHVGNTSTSLEETWSISEPVPKAGSSRSRNSGSGRIRKNNVRTKSIPITEVTDPAAFKNAMKAAVKSGELFNGDLETKLARASNSGALGVQLDMSQAPVEQQYTTFDPLALQDPSQGWNVGYLQENLPAPLVPDLSFLNWLVAPGTGNLLEGPANTGYGWGDGSGHAYAQPPVAPQPSVLPEANGHPPSTPANSGQQDIAEFFNADIGSAPSSSGVQPGDSVIPMPPTSNISDVVDGDGIPYLHPSQDKSHSWEKSAHGSVRFVSATMNYPADYDDCKLKFQMHHTEVTPPDFLRVPMAERVQVLPVPDDFAEQMGPYAATRVINANVAAMAGSSAQAQVHAPLPPAQEAEEDLRAVMQRVLGN